jgi:hypothetical protein
VAHSLLQQPWAASTVRCALCTSAPAKLLILPELPPTGVDAALVKMLLCAEAKVGCFRKCLFWNSAEYGILYGIDFISRNSAKIVYCTKPRNSAGFCIGLCLWNSVDLQMKIHV